MATYEAWKKLEEEFGAQDVISVRDIFSYPEEPMDEEAKAILKRYKQGEKLTREEVLTLPYGMQEIYYLEREGELEAPELLRQRRMEERVANRRKQHEKEQAIYERVLRKNLGSVELTPQEIAIYNKFRSNAYSMDASEVNVNTVDLLNDIVKGDYTLVDVQIAQNGTEIRSVETSPMQLLEKVVEETKKRTQNALFTSDTAQFFPQIDSDASIRITPMQLDSIIATCTTGIDMIIQHPFDENETRHACESYTKALAMQEAENKIKNAIEDSRKRHIKDIEKLAEIGAVAAATGEDLEADEGEKAEDVWSDVFKQGFNITNTSYDVSFVPGEEPDADKPIEIISYIGMTK